MWDRFVKIISLHMCILSIQNEQNPYLQYKVGIYTNNANSYQNVSQQLPKRYSKLANNFLLKFNFPLLIQNFIL